jgi:hypothetical protein
MYSITLFADRLCDISLNMHVYVCIWNKLEPAVCMYAYRYSYLLLQRLFMMRHLMFRDCMVLLLTLMLFRCTSMCIMSSSCWCMRIRFRFLSSVCISGMHIMRVLEEERVILEANETFLDGAFASAFRLHRAK